jgi:hypothetical protein
VVLLYLQKLALSGDGAEAVQPNELLEHLSLRITV